MPHYTNAMSICQSVRANDNLSNNLDIIMKVVHVFLCPLRRPVLFLTSTKYITPYTNAVKRNCKVLQLSPKLRYKTVICYKEL